MNESPDMKDIERCAICLRRLKADRAHVDTCSERCFKRQLRRQRAAYGFASISALQGQRGRS